MSIHPVSYSTFPSRSYKTIGASKPDTKNFTKFTPCEFKLGESRVTLNDVYSRGIFLSHKELKISEETLKNDKGKWINKLYSGEWTYKELIEEIKAAGFSNEEAKELLDEAIYHSERSADWAKDNEVYGGISGSSALVSALLGILNKIIENNESVPDSIKSITGTLQGVTYAARGYFQYGKVYGRKTDDERAKNNYEGEFYGNKISSVFGDLANTFETKINPISLVALSLTSKKTQSIITPILFLANILWWKVRMLGEVRQDFATDLFSYLVHKPLTLLKINESVDKVKKLKEKGYLNYPFVQRRLIELIGLDPNKHKLINTFPELARLLKVLLSNDKKLAKDASHNIGKFLAPVFGFYGCVAVGIGVPVKSVLKWLDTESRYINAFATSGIFSQQLLYLFRMMLPEQFDNQVMKIEGQGEEIKKLKSQRNYLFYTGIANCTGSIMTTILKLFNLDENSYLKLGREILDELVDKGIANYFSRRRELRGIKHRLDNPELYNIDGTPKIISDKVKIEDEKGLAVSAA